jgi:transcriptional regulator with XRE-family HTH domain
VEFSQHWIVPLAGRHADEVAVSNWLSGRNEPNLQNLLRLSAALKIEPIELIKMEIQLKADIKKLTRNLRGTTKARLPSC